ncbi:MAG: hypothetical protein R2824_35445 [Saprospiraceae bacterium]
MNTVELVSKIIAQKYNTASGRISEVIVFNTKESRKLHAHQANLYRKYLGDEIIMSDLLVDDSGLIDPKKISDIFSSRLNAVK